MLNALIGTTSYCSAQIFEEREYRGKQIMCMRSGLMGWGRPCGTDGRYAYIFIGSVRSVTEISETEKRLQITPQEMFLGDFASRLTVTTNQGACLPEIMSGDQWLFYLRRDDKTKGLRLEYGDPSKPIANAQPTIAMLRRLALMTDSGLVMGNLYREVWNVDEDGTKWTTSVPISNHKVIAKRDSDGAEYSAFTNGNGDYEFEPLPSGSYHLSANTAEGLWAQEGPTTVHSRGCTAYQIEIHADGRISGHVSSADGKPPKIHPWVEVETEDGDRFASFYADEQGFFEATGLEPGRYRVGIGMRAEPATPEWRSRVYYPGVQSKEQATVIELGKAEKRRDVDFQLPNPTSQIK